MLNRVVIAVIAVLGLLIAVQSSWADSNITYPDDSRSQALDLGGGRHGFVFIDVPGDNDIFIHAVDFNAFLLFVQIPGTGFNGFAMWLDFEGFNGNFLQYGVYTCNGGPPCFFGSRRGTLFL